MEIEHFCLPKHNLKFMKEVFVGAFVRRVGVQVLSRDHPTIPLFYKPGSSTFIIYVLLHHCQQNFYMYTLCSIGSRYSVQLVATNQDTMLTVKSLNGFTDYPSVYDVQKKDFRRSLERKNAKELSASFFLFQDLRFDNVGSFALRFALFDKVCWLIFLLMCIQYIIFKNRLCCCIFIGARNS